MNIKKLSIAGVMLCAFVACFTSCSKDDDITSSETQQQSLRFNIYDAAAQSDTRSATDAATMTTVFEVADKAGLYVVKNGEVLYDNLTLTYNAAGFWEAEEKIDVTDQLTGAQFYAYYPYNASAVFNASSSTPFAEMVAAAKPAAKQSTKAEFEAADIMVTSAATIGKYNAVDLPLVHQKSLVYMELPNVSYIFDNDGMAPYVLSKSENVSFTLNDATVSPYFDDESQSYMFIVEPETAAVLKASYTMNGVATNYATPDLSAIKAGQYAKFIVDGGAKLTHMTLKVGDYYCADGNIVSQDAGKVPSNAVGVIYKLSTSESLRNTNANWSHGMVISLAETKSKWGNDASTSSEENAAGWRYWYRSYNLADQNGVTNAAQLKEDIMYEEGYGVTKAWLAVPEPLTIGGFTKDYTTVMRSLYESWTTTTVIPQQVTSGWFIPSLGDWKAVEAEASSIETPLKAAGGKAFSGDPYWSSNVRGAGSNWCYVMNKTALADRYKGTGLKDSRLFRYVFAF